MPTPKTSDINWEKLRKLRDFFLQAEGRQTRSYWDRELLELYDATFARRIRVKWDHVLAELGQGLIATPTLLDWGCGSGVATEAYLDYATNKPAKALFFDVSKTSSFYCVEKFRSQYPTIQFAATENKAPEGTFTLLISHVVNELPPSALEDLRRLIPKAAQTIWVEPGSKDVSRQLSTLRDSLRDKVSIVAPCPHGGSCGILAAGNEENWCHFFCKVPSYFSTESFWREFSKEMSIDLRSIPLSYLVLQQQEVRERLFDKRILGTVRTYKGHQKFQLCREEGVSEFTLQQRNNPALFKKLKKDPTAPWEEA